MSTWRRVLGALMVAVALSPTPARANGWEHGAVPFEALVQALRFEHAATRARAAQSLGYRGQPEGVEPLLARLRAPERDPHVRRAIYGALGQLGDARALPALRGCLERETRAELRGDCVSALGGIGGEQALEAVLRAARSDPSFLVRSRAVDALGAFDDERAVKALVAVLEGSNHSLRRRAITALGRTGAAAAAPPLLRVLARAEGTEIRIALVDALAALGQRSAVAPLRRLAAEAEDAELRAHAAVALGAVRDGSAYPTLVALLSDEVPAVRYFALDALRKLGRPEGAAPVSALSLGISERLARRSGAALVEDALATAGALSLQVLALQALTELDASAGLEAFRAAAHPRRDLPRDSAAALRIAEGFYRVRRAALYGLGYTGAEAAVDLLLGEAGVQDPDPRLRALAVRALGVLGFERGLPAVVGALEDPAAEVRWTAASVLGRTGAPGAVEPLLRRLEDAHAQVRRQAALSLGYLGAARARAALQRLAREDPSAEVREAAAYGAALLEGSRARSS